MKCIRIISFFSFLLFCTPRACHAELTNPWYIANDNPQYISLCIVGATLAAGGVYAFVKEESWLRKITVGLPPAIVGIGLIIASKEILLAFNKAVLEQ